MGHILQLLDSAAIDCVAPPATVVQGDFRPRILLPGQSGRLIDDFAGDLLNGLSPREIFNRGGLVTFIDDARNKLAPMTQSTFRSWLENEHGGRVVCQKWIGTGDASRLEDVSMSEEAAKAVLASPRFVRGLRKISRLNAVRQPIRRKDHAIELLPAGYDEESQIHTLDSVSFDHELPLEDAKAFLRELLADTAFDPKDQERSMSAALSMMLAPFVDCTFDRFAIRPVFIVTANTEGAGKTMLAQLAIAPTFGTTKLTPPPAADNADKLNELLNSIAQSGAPYVVFDNWRGKVEHGGLEAFATAPTWAGRVLGSSSTFEVDKQCLVLITVNHATVGSDMRRRSIFIQLFVEEAKAEDRHIARPISEADIIAKRDRILAALWALVRSWRDAGRPPGRVRNASFDEWGRTVGGILEFAGWPSPLLPPPDPLDERLHNMTELVKAVLAARSLDDETFLKPAELLSIARESGCFPRIIAAEEPDETKFVRAEAQQLGKHCGYYRGGRVFTMPDGDRIKFNVVGEGHQRKYGFVRINK